MASACSDPAGLRVDVAFGAFKDARSLKIAIAASPDGFKPMPPANTGGATITTEDVDGDGVIDLVAKFLGPFDAGSLSFRVATGNQIELAMHGTALAFDDAELVAGAGGDATLPAGGATTMSLALTAQTSGTVGPGTRTTDLLTAPPDLTVAGPARGMGTSGAQASAIAVCNLQGSGFHDLVVGVPNLDPGLNIGPTGAVFVVFGDGSTSSTVTLSLGDSNQFSFHGAEGGDQLGASVGCADVNLDGFDDLIVAAPNASGGSGRIYVVFGRPALKRTVIDLASTDHLPDATWSTAVADAHLGSAMFAGNVGSNGRPVVLASAPGNQKVHLVTDLGPTTTANLDIVPHTTFANLRGGALGAGDLHQTGDALDVIIGDPTYVVPGDVMPSGAVYVFGAVPPTVPTAYDATAAGSAGPSTMIVGPPQSGFGAAVLALDTTGRYQDLFVGAPQDGSDGQGRVYVYEHQDTFFLAPRRNNSTYVKLLELGVANAHFGAALGVSLTGTVSTASWSLLVGAPDERRGQRAAAGAAYRFAPGADRRLPIMDVLYGANAGDHLGSAVTGGQLDGGPVGDLVTVAPFATGADAGSGVVYVELGAR